MTSVLALTVICHCMLMTRHAKIAKCHMHNTGMHQWPTGLVWLSGFNIDYAQADDMLEAYRLFCGAKAKISLKSFKQAIGRAEASRCIAVSERLYPVKWAKTP